MLAFQDTDLLAESGQFEGEVMSRAKKGTEPGKNAEKELNHSIILQEQKAMIDKKRTMAISLISRSDMVLATDNPKWQSNRAWIYFCGVQPGRWVMLIDLI